MRVNHRITNVTVLEQVDQNRKLPQKARRAEWANDLTEWWDKFMTYTFFATCFRIYARYIPQKIAKNLCQILIFFQRKINRF